MNLAMILFIISVHLMALFLIFVFLKMLPKIWLVLIPSRKKILLGLSVSYIISIAFVILLNLHGKTYPPPNELPNNYYEGKIEYLDSGKTPRDVGSVILVYEKDGKRKKLECYTPTFDEIKAGAIPCGHDNLAHQELDGKIGKVWYYNDFSAGNQQDGRFYTRYIAVQLVTKDPKKIYPYKTQVDVVKNQINEKKNNPWNHMNIVSAVGFCVFFVIGFIALTANNIIQKEQ